MSPDLTTASAFVAATGLQLTEVTGTRVAGHVEVGPQHHTPWGVVHGHGVWCCGPRLMCPVTRVPVASANSRPAAATNGLAEPRSTGPVTRRPR